MATERVTTSTDDAYETNLGTIITNSTTVTLGAITDLCGIRFQTVAIDQGSTIKSATLKIEAEYNCAGAGNCSVKFYGVDADDTSTWGSSNKISSQTKTTANVPWSSSTNSSYATRSIDVKLILNEIVNRVGWVSGNDLSFITDDGSFGRRTSIVWRTYDYGFVPYSGRPVLEFEFTPPASDTKIQRTLMGVKI